MNKILIFIKTHKTLFIFLPFFTIIICAILISLLNPENNKPRNLSPIVLKPEELTTKPLNTIELKSYTPPQVKRTTIILAEAIKFTFSDAVDINSVKISVNPKVNIVKKTDESDVNTLIIFPVMEEVWQPYTNYTINILELSSISGNKLKNIVTYKYYNEPPGEIETEN